MLYVWAILAIAAALAAGYLGVAAMSHPPGLRGIARAIDAEPGRPGLRDADLSARLAGQPTPRTVRVAAGSRRIRLVLVIGGVLALATLALTVSGSGLVWLVGTASLVVSAALAYLCLGERQWRAHSRAIQLRRMRTRFNILDESIRRVGFVPSPKPSRTLPYGHVRLALWCTAEAIVGLPEELAEVATVDGETAWLLLDGIETISTAQLVGLRLMYSDRWVVADARGVPREAGEPELPALFDVVGSVGFDRDRATYTVDGLDVANAVERQSTLRGRVSKDPKALPHTFEVRDALLQTRWVIRKPDAAWRTAFYVTDRLGRRVGTLRAVMEGSDGFDLCGTDNQVVATLRSGDERASIVDTRGETLALWDKLSGEFTVDAPGGSTARLLCLLAPVVDTFMRAGR